jgi:hypothetical protein
VRRLVPALLLGVLPALAQPYPAPIPPDHPAIRYTTTPANDPIARLAHALDTGAATLDYGPQGYLASLLSHLGIDANSQALVFSKTSFQASKIGPRTPRAIYFTDDAAVGWVPGGDGFELAGLDPRQGYQFYTLDIHESPRPRIARRAECLHCHQGNATLGVPGIFIGSVFPDVAGNANAATAIITDQRTPFADRWGGWYVDAARGHPRDRSAAVALDPAEPETLTRLLLTFDRARYLSPHSDIVALMTFEHQTHMTNLITRVNWESRTGAQPRIDELIDYMLFVGEARLPGPIEGASTFTKTFPQRGPRDRQGRSLRDFDLKTRLFRYPLSYMIYSPAFAALPEEVRERVHQRLNEILSGKDPSPRYAHLTPEIRQASFAILRDTNPHLFQ